MDEYEEMLDEFKGAYPGIISSQKKGLVLAIGALNIPDFIECFFFLAVKRKASQIQEKAWDESEILRFLEFYEENMAEVGPKRKYRYKISMFEAAATAIGNGTTAAQCNSKYVNAISPFSPD